MDVIFKRDKKLDVEVCHLDAVLPALVVMKRMQPQNRPLLISCLKQVLMFATSCSCWSHPCSCRSNLAPAHGFDIFSLSSRVNPPTHPPNNFEPNPSALVVLRLLCPDPLDQLLSWIEWNKEPHIVATFFLTRTSFKVFIFSHISVYFYFVGPFFPLIT